MLIGLKQNKTHLSKIPLVNETNFFPLGTYSKSLMIYHIHKQVIGHQI